MRYGGSRAKDMTAKFYGGTGKSLFWKIANSMTGFGDTAVHGRCMDIRYDRRGVMTSLSNTL